MTQKKEKSEERKAIEQKAQDAIAALPLHPLKWPFANRHADDLVFKSQDRVDVVPLPHNHERDWVK